MAAENRITVSLLSSTLSRESFTKSDSGSLAVTAKKESAAMRDRERILIAKAACFSDNMLISSLYPELRGTK